MMLQNFRVQVMRELRNHNCLIQNITLYTTHSDKLYTLLLKILI